MTTFDERENAFEAKFAHDEEMQFKAQARCNKLLGLWAAAKLGKTGSDAEDYAKTVVIADMEEAGHEDVYRKVAGDLGGKSRPIWAVCPRMTKSAPKWPSFCPKPKLRS